VFTFSEIFEVRTRKGRGRRRERREKKMKKGEFYTASTAAPPMARQPPRRSQLELHRSSFSSSEKMKDREKEER